MEFGFLGCNTGREEYILRLSLVVSSCNSLDITNPPLSFKLLQLTVLAD